MDQLKSFVTPLYKVASRNYLERVGKQGYVMFESYRNAQELFNLQCRALTCESFSDTAGWI